MILSEIIELVRSGATHGSDLWLFITGDPRALSLDTDCELAELSIDEDDDFREIAPAGFEQRGLSSTIDLETLVECIRCADRLAGGADPAACCEVIRYYIRFDAWPANLGAEDPPPVEEIIARLDREFFDSLSPEQPGTECRRDGCARETIQFSVLCRAHHFERIKNKPCPFER